MRLIRRRRLPQHDNNHGEHSTGRRNVAWVIGIPGAIVALAVIVGYLANRNTLVHHRQLQEAINKKLSELNGNPVVASEFGEYAQRIDEVQPGQGADVVVRIGHQACANLYDAFESRSTQGQEARQHLRAHIAILELLTEDTTSSIIRSTAQAHPEWRLWLGRIRAREMDYLGWEEQVQLALTHAEALTDTNLLVETLVDGAACLIHRDHNLEDAARYLAQAASLIPATTKVGYALYVLQYQTLLDVKLGDYDQALATNQRYFQTLSGHNDAYWLAEGHKLRGVILAAQDHPADAVSEFEQALDFARQWIRDSATALQADILDEIGQARLSLAQPVNGAARTRMLRLALANFQESLRLSEQIDKDQGIAFESRMCGRTFWRLGIPDSAIYYLKRSIRVYSKARSLDAALIRSQLELYEIYQKLGNTVEARAYADSVSLVLDRHPYGTDTTGLAKEMGVKGRLKSL